MEGGGVEENNREKVKASPSRATPSKTVSPPPKSGPAKKISILKIAQPNAKLGP
jgi:hypothetical protein